MSNERGAPTVARVLIVDDEPDLAQALTLRLRAAGFAVAAALDGETGIALAARDVPDVIVLDLGLPGMDGYAAMAHLRAHAATSRIPVIVVTARAAGAERARVHLAGAAGFFGKPVHLPDLLTRIREVLDRAV